MKKNNPFVLLILVCILLIQTDVASAHILPSKSLQSDNLSVTFEELGYLDFTLHSPFDSNTLRFTVPPNWKFEPGASISLSYDVLISGPDVLDATEDRREFGGAVAVSFNRQIVETIYVDRSGNYSLTIPIPDSALESVRPDGRHILEFDLLAGESCEYDIRTSVTIKDESLFTFPYESLPPTLDLARMPYPFYPVPEFLPNQTVFVLPASPELDEVKAAMNLFSGFGQMTGSDFSYSVVTAGELTDELLSSADLIFVGKPDKFDLLADVQFPQPVSEGRFSNLNENNTEDGVIQFANSPWNAEKAVLLVSGDTGEAVNKAAQAISTGEIFTAADPQLVLVSAVHPLEDSQVAVESFYFSDQGFLTKTYRGFGVFNDNINFYLPREQVGSTEAFIDLKYLSNLFTAGRETSIAVTLNGSLLTAIDVTSPTENLNTSHIDIPPGLLRFGENRLEIQIKLIPNFTCDPGRLQDNFITILDDSILNIPVTPTEISDSTSVDLGFYPDLFLTASDLSDITFILPQSSPAAWKVAAQIAYSLGRTVNPGLSTLNVIFGEDVQQESLNNQSLIIVGKASTLPVLNEINEMLPAPFDFTTDTASEDSLQISYRIPPDTSLGYLELVTSPFDNDRVLLVISGNTDDGIQFAGNALTLSEFRSSLSGQFAVTNGIQIATTRVNTPRGLGSSFDSIVVTVAPDSERVVNTPFPTVVQQEREKPVWLLPIFILSGILVVLLLLRNLYNPKVPQNTNIDLDKLDEE